MTGTTAKSRESFEQPRLLSQPLKKISLQRGIIYGPVPSRRLRWKYAAPRARRPTCAQVTRRKSAG